MADKLLKPKPKTYGHDYDLDNNPVDLFAMELETKLSESIYQRQEIDDRMIQDLQMYHGVYDPNTKAKLKDSPRSKVFNNLSRAKTNAAESQLVDLLFQTDDSNWGIEPTPKPELAQRLKDDEPAQLNGVQYQYEDTGEVVKNSDVAKRETEVVNEAAENMSTLIDDQLVETQYDAKARQVIHDGCVVGTGIAKGPIISGKLRRSFQPTPERSFAPVMEHKFVPGVEVVRPWDFFPDPSAATIEECEFTFERRWLSRKQVRNLVFQKGFDSDQVRRVLKMKAKETQHQSGFLDDVRVLAGLNDDLNDTRYELWEYHGPIPKNVLVGWGVKIKKKDLEDPLAEISGIVHYCGGIVLGVKLHLIDYDQAFPYRIFNWEEDDSSIFGYGVPRICRDQQDMINSVTRMMYDNAAITAGPQIGVNRKKVQPIDGNWEITPFKTWDLKDVQDVRQVFSSVEFNSHLNELQGLYGLARVLIDEVSGVPMLQQGEQGPSSPTLGGMSMLMNAANTVRRRQVKQWDDAVTKPMIRDFYHFNMIHSKDEKVKGDFQVKARGTSALLVKEQTANAISNYLGMIGSSEAFQPVLQLKSREIMQAWAKTQTLPKDVIPTKDELDEYYAKMEEQQAQQAQQEQPQDPQVMTEQLRMQQLQEKHKFEAQRLQMEQQFDQQQRDLDRKLKMMQLAEQREYRLSQEKQELMRLAQQDKISKDKLLLELEKLDRKLKSDWDSKALEAEMKNRFGKDGNYGIE